MAELLANLSEREKAHHEASIDAQERIREAESKVTLASQELMELKRAHEQEFKILKAQWEKRARDTAYKCRQEVQKARKERAELVGLADNAEAQRKKAESRANHLTAKVRELHVQLEKRMQQQDERLTLLNRFQDARAERVSVQCEDRIDKMTKHANKVAMMSSAAVDSTVEELQGQAARANFRAEGRVRYGELCDLAKSVGNYDMTKDAYYRVKDDLISLWHIQAGSSTPSRVRTAPASVQRTCTSPFGASTALQLAQSTPRSYGSSRSGVERAPGSHTSDPKRAIGGAIRPSNLPRVRANGFMATA
eukprot:TRINITY_DN56659_c0_g1_i1.p1 TRINITY_DN56659_c0_g1~~TRINITY_DN56659_c0_g1_i1.p1  ORF type:complete len:344 (-),score=38.55 TRINITY_DN56659_c0_g1_i1:59-982(-)